MASLPTVVMTEAQVARILAAFGGETAYRAWLRDRVVDHVVDHEQKRMAAEALTAQRDALAALRAELAEPTTT